MHKPQAVMKRYKPPGVKELKLYVSCWQWSLKQWLEQVYGELGLKVDWLTVIHHGLMRLVELLEREYGIKPDWETVRQIQAQCEAESSPAV